jgi:antitoxin component YwqK of YwqJK toxin-antitoxin module
LDLTIIMKSISPYKTFFLLVGLYAIFELIRHRGDFRDYQNMTQPPKGTLILGKKEGQWKTYYLNGQIAGIDHYRHDTLDGQSLVYAPNGNLRSKITHNMGLPIDSFLIYTEEGTLNVMRIYDSSGILIEDGITHNGIVVGSKKIPRSNP